MSFPVRFLCASEEARIGEACRALGLEAGRDLRVDAQIVQVRAQAVLARPSRPGAATVLVVPAVRTAAKDLVAASAALATALVEEGARASAVLPDAVPSEGGPQGSARARLASEIAPGVELELFLDLGDPEAARATRAGWERALEPRLAVTADGVPLLVGPGQGALVGTSVLGERIATRCADWVVVPCGAGPLGLHRAVEIRGRRIGHLPKAVVLWSVDGELGPSALRAIRAARLHGLEVAVCSPVEIGDPCRAAVRAAGAAAFGGRAALRAVADWVRSVRAVDARAACYLAARDTPLEARVRAVVERVLGGELVAPVPSTPDGPGAPGDFLFDAPDPVSAPRFAVGESRWLGSVGITRVELRPEGGPEG